MRLKPVIEEMSQKSKALAANLERIILRFQASDRYLRAAKQEEVAIKEKELEGEEFLIFREYVRLLRSCTIMCGKDLSHAYRDLFIEFFAGKRLDLARGLEEK